MRDWEQFVLDVAEAKVAAAERRNEHFRRTIDENASLHDLFDLAAVNLILRAEEIQHRRREVRR